MFNPILFMIAFAGLNVGSNFSVGATLINYTFYDAANNSASCAFTVKVIGKSMHLLTLLCMFVFCYNGTHPPIAS